VLTTTAICDLYANLYVDTPAPQGTWDHLLPIDGAYAAIKRIDGIDYVMLRGSVTPMDWIEDFEDCALPFNDSLLGDVHPGARLGALMVREQINALVGEHVVFVGHSLGAMHAALLAGYRVATGKPVDALVMFGEPRTGGPRLSEILAKTQVNSFRNADGGQPLGVPLAHDLVTDVARCLPPILPYQHVRDPLTDCWRSPKTLDAWGPFAWHHFRLYAEAFGAAGSAVLALPDGGEPPQS
jgi:Lipase (class 3)